MLVGGASEDDLIDGLFEIIDLAATGKNCYLCGVLARACIGLAGLLW